MSAKPLDPVGATRAMRPFKLYFNRVLVKGFNFSYFSYHNAETLLFTIDPYYGNSS